MLNINNETKTFKTTVLPFKILIIVTKKREERDLREQQGNTSDLSQREATSRSFLAWQGLLTLGNSTGVWKPGMSLGAIPLSPAQGDVAACSGPKAGKRAFLSDLLTQSYGDLCPSSLQSQR